MQMYRNKFKRTKQSFIFFEINLQLVILSMVYIKKEGVSEPYAYGLIHPLGDLLKCLQLLELAVNLIGNLLKLLF